MSMASREELKNMYQAAIAFKESPAWKQFKDTQFFMVHDEEKDLEGYCHIVPLKENGVSFSVYLGEEGFGSFRYLYDKMALAHHEHVILKGNLRRICLTVSFNEDNWLISDDVEQADDLGFVFPDIVSQPVFNYYHPDLQLMPKPIDDGWQCRFLTTALKQALEVSQLQAAGRLKVPKLGDSTYYLRFEESGKWQGTFADSKLFNKGSHRTSHPFTNDIMAHRLRKLGPRSVVLEAIQFYVPQPVVILEKADSFYMLITALVDSEYGEVYFLDIQETRECNRDLLLRDLSAQLIELGFRPNAIVAEDEAVYSLLEDFCKQAEISLRLDHHCLKGHEFVGYILNELKSEALQEGADSVSELLDFVEDLTDLLEAQDIWAHLSQSERSHYQVIVQTVVLAMYTIKNQAPHQWEKDALLDIIFTVLPEQLERPVLADAKNVLKHFITLMGTEAMIPNYLELLKVVTKL